MTGRAGIRIVLTAPLTESTDHWGFFIQMSPGVDPRVDGVGDLATVRPDWREAMAAVPDGMPKGSPRRIPIAIRENRHVASPGA